MTFRFAAEAAGRLRARFPALILALSVNVIQLSQHTDDHEVGKHFRRRPQAASVQRFQIKGDVVFRDFAFWALHRHGLFECISHDRNDARSSGVEQACNGSADSQLRQGVDLKLVREMACQGKEEGLGCDEERFRGEVDHEPHLVNRVGQYRS